MVDKEKICQAMAKGIRRDIIEITYQLGGTGTHLGGSLSLAEIMAVLYGAVLNVSNDAIRDENRDRLIFSKGHGALAMYAAMRHAGLITEEELKTYKTDHTFLSAHPSMNSDRGIEFSSGSLGQGLSLAVGTCLGLQRKHNNISRVFVILGDGECDEGSVWEAAQSAVHFGCTNLTVVVDCNGLQYDGETEKVMSLGTFGDKWRSFGWRVAELDGHDVSQLLVELSKDHEGPNVIIAHTVKGKGISYMENNPLWHNHSINEKQYEQALNELESGCVM